MSIQINKELARRWTSLINLDNWESHLTELAEFFDKPEDAEAFFDEHRKFRQAFANFHSTIDDIVVEGNQIAIFTTVRATHVAEYPYGEFKGVAPTGKDLEWTEASLVTLHDGKVIPSTSDRFIVDGVSRLQQLGVLTAPE
jgi:predicted ester cyclase